MSTVNNGAIWAILIASGKAEEPDRETQLLLQRARSVAAPDKISVIIEEKFHSDWRVLARSVLPELLWPKASAESTQAAIVKALTSLATRDPQANIILIPADHCAAEENAWVACAKNAVRLAASSANTVFILHDKPENDPRTSQDYPGVCSSSVMIGSIHSVRDLCLGAKAIAIVDVNLEDADALPVSSLPQSAPLRVLHITSVDEYAKLQRGEYGRPRSRIDVRA